jgi:ketosteroid isomerase-like protein
MSDDEGFQAALAQREQATRRFVNGDASALKALLAERDDVTFFGNFGGYERGWQQVAERLDWAALPFVEGDVEIETLASGASGDLGYAVTLERGTIRTTAGETRRLELRVTLIFRREDGAWRLVHRHADPLRPKDQAPRPGR